MIAFKDNDKVYFAVPMPHYGCGTAEADYDYEDNAPIWHLDDSKGTIAMATGGISRGSDILRYSDALNCEELNLEGVREVLKKIPGELEGTNCQIRDGCIGIGLCIARGNEMYEISKFGTTKRIADVEAYDTIRSAALVIWERVKHISDVKKRVKEYYKLIQKESNSECFPVMLMSTGESGHDLIYNTGKNN